MLIEKIHAAAQPLGDIGADPNQGLGPFASIMSGHGNIGDAVNGLKNVTNVVSSIIGVITVVAGIWFFFNFIIGGIQWISAGGDKHNLEQAQQRITNAFIGLIIVFAGWTILALAGKFLGFDILISNPSKIIQQLFPGGTVNVPNTNAIPAALPGQAVPNPL